MCSADKKYSTYPIPSWKAIVTLKPAAGMGQITQTTALNAIILPNIRLWMRASAGAAVFGIIMPLSLRGEVLGEMDGALRAEIIKRCGGAGLGGVAPEVVAAMVDSLDAASTAEALEGMGCR